jgi:GPH family glycoside/pentoside/hexuronide:cation symporter
MSVHAAERVPWGSRLAYAAPALVLAVVGIPVYVYLPKFYTDVVGVHIGVLGVLMLAVRLFDAVTDPLIGALSDRTRTRFGRRRPWIAGGVWPLAFVVVLLFVPPQTDATGATIWFGVFIFALFLFWTAVTVPYESLGPEITFDYDERTRLLGLRDGALIAGTLLAVSCPVAIVWAFGLTDDPSGERAKFMWIAVIYAPLLILVCSWCSVVVSERGFGLAADRRPRLFNLGAMRRNRPFAILLVSYTISALGSNLPGTLILFYVEYVLESNLAELFLVLYFVSGIAFLPAWVALSARIGKKPAWILSMVINTGAFVGVFFLGAGDAPLYGILVVLSGVGLGATLALPSAMQADVIDYDELLSGERREGQYIGAWSVAKKLAAALGVGASLTILGVVGYEPNVEQTAEVKLTLRILYALVPSVLNLVAIAIAVAYPIDRVYHRRILDSLEVRRRGGPAADPLESSPVVGEAPR